MSLNIGTRLQIYEKLKTRIDFSTLFAHYLTLFNTPLPFRNYLALRFVTVNYGSLEIYQTYHLKDFI